MKYLALAVAACCLLAQLSPTSANCGCGQGCDTSTGCCTQSLCSQYGTTCTIPDGYGGTFSAEQDCCESANTAYPSLTCIPYSPGGTQGVCKSPDCTGSNKDPWFAGFDGSRYEFTGYPFHFFAILSDANIQVNAWFAPVPEHPEWENANSMQQLGFMVGTDRINITELDYQKLAVEINGKLIPLASTHTEVRVSDNLLVTYTDGTAEAAFHSEYVTITTDDFIFTVSAPPPWMHVSFRFDGMGLALQASQTKDSVTSPSVHGVLGLTLNPAWVGKVANKPYVVGVTTEFEAPVFHGPGSHRDYEVSDLFATDFSFNAFNGTALARKQAPTLQRAEARKLMAVSDSFQPLTASVQGNAR